jgi:hypothetical protein
VGDPPAGRSRRLSFTRLQNGRQHTFIVVNLIHCRLSPTRPFSERSPTLQKVAHLTKGRPPYKRLSTLQKVAHLIKGCPLYKRLST